MTYGNEVSELFRSASSSQKIGSIGITALTQRQNALKSLHSVRTHFKELIFFRRLFRRSGVKLSNSKHADVERDHKTHSSFMTGLRTALLSPSARVCAMDFIREMFGHIDEPHSLVLSYKMLDTRQETLPYSAPHSLSSDLRRTVPYPETSIRAVIVRHKESEGTLATHSR